MAAQSASGTQRPAGTGNQAGAEAGRPPSSAKISTTKTALILVGTIGGTIAGLWAFLRYTMPDVGTLSGHGIVAMTLGIVFSLVVGIGLMGLVFYSSRRGYDDDAVYRRKGHHHPAADAEG